jgi:hypothetical protein
MRDRLAMAADLVCSGRLAPYLSWAVVATLAAAIFAMLWLLARRRR